MEDPRKEPEYRDEDSAEDIVETYLIEADVTGLCALADVVAERKRQVEKEGWTHEHDDGWYKGEMAAAAACYAAPEMNKKRVPILGSDRQTCDVPHMWPWAVKWWKPKTIRKNLVRAAALILAEIERLDRAAAKQ